jgi:predicted kinase
MLTIIRGMPGSGKSTLAQAIQNNDILGARIFEADDYFITAQGYQFDPSKLKEAHHICQVKTKTWLTTGRHAIVSNTFTQRWEYQPYLDMAAELGVSVQVIEVHGDFGNIHGVPDETIAKMRARWEPHR